MKYVGIHTQQRENNFKSVLLLLLFPVILLGMVWIFLAILNNLYGDPYWLDLTNEQFVNIAPWCICGVGIWFVIAYMFNTAMIRRATNAHPVDRKDCPRVYNIVENLCMTCGMDMPKINIVNDPMLNAFASGIDKNSYTVTVTTGLMDLLDDRELAGVIGHELTHIRNRDTRLLITSIIFVGVVSTVMSLISRMIYYNMWYGGGSSRRDRRDSNDGPAGLIVMFVALVCSAIAYVFVILTRFAISRKREYMADAGGAELCGEPFALASALRKISYNPGLGDVKREDVAQLFIIRPKMSLNGGMNFLMNLFSTHPDVNKRIAILEQF